MSFDFKSFFTMAFVLGNAYFSAATKTGRALYASLLYIIGTASGRVLCGYCPCYLIGLAGGRVLCMVSPPPPLDHLSTAHLGPY